MCLCVCFFLFFFWGGGGRGGGGGVGGGVEGVGDVRVCLTSILITNNSSVVSRVVPECAMKRSATFNEIHSSDT